MVGRPFVKGQSGNPSGAPKDQARAWARKYGKEAVEKLAQIMRNDEAGPKAQCTAAMGLLDRGFGKPKQSVDLTDTRKREVRELSKHELASAVADILTSRGSVGVGILAAPTSSGEHGGVSEVH